MPHLLVQLQHETNSLDPAPYQPFVAAAALACAFAASACSSVAPPPEDLLRAAAGAEAAAAPDAAPANHNQRTTGCFNTNSMLH